MARELIDDILNMSDRATKQRFDEWVWASEGLYEVLLKPTRPHKSHTDAQRRYFHGPMLKALYLRLNEPGVGTGQHYTKEKCKDILVAATMGTVPVIDPRTGEVLQETRPSTADYSIEDYSTMIERGLEWFDKLDIRLQPFPAWARGVGYEKGADAQKE